MVHSYGIWYNMEIQRTFWKQVREIVHSDGIQKYLELQLKRLKSRTINGVFWRYLKLQRSFWDKDAFAYIIATHSEMIFETAMRRNNTYFDLIKGREVGCVPVIMDF